jgi:hypothetical protein
MTDVPIPVRVSDGVVGFYRATIALFEIHGHDGRLLVRLSEDEPSFVDTERLGEVAGIFIDEVIGQFVERGRRLAARETP